MLTLHMEDCSVLARTSQVASTHTMAELESFKIPHIFYHLEWAYGSTSPYAVGHKPHNVSYLSEVPLALY